MPAAAAVVARIAATASTTPPPPLGSIETAATRLPALVDWASPPLAAGDGVVAAVSASKGAVVDVDDASPSPPAALSTGEEVAAIERASPVSQSTVVEVIATWSMQQ